MAHAVTSRAAGLPLPLPGEVERRRLLDRIADRWHCPVTLVVAGAGFGKSTLLAQAVRANAPEPRGIDIWHGCKPGDVDADVLCRSLLNAMDVDVRHPDIGVKLADALASYSPIDVCLVLDDAHELRSGSSGANLISALVRYLPHNAHVLLAARHTPPGEFSRLRAADRILELTQEDLLFTDDETADMAARFGRDPADANRLGGWPALVRLSLATRPDIAMDFAQEEVLNRMSDAERRALFALSSMGYSDHERVSKVVGSPVDLDQIAATVPLVSRTEDGQFRAHDLWTSALQHLLDPTAITELRRRVVDQLIDDRDLARAGGIAVAHHDVDALAKVTLDMVRDTLVALPLDTVTPWNRALQRGRPEAPEARLLSAAIDQARDFTDAGVDADIDAAVEGFRESNNTNGEIVALAVGTISAVARGDVSRLVSLSSRADAIPGSHDDPTMNLAAHSIAAALAEMSGDVEQALVELRAARIDRVSPVIGAAANRLLIHCLLLSGRADEAVDVTQKLLERSPDKAARYMTAIARWMAGEPSDLVELGRPTIDVPAMSSRDEFVRRTMVASMLASAGREAEVRRLVGTDEPQNELAQIDNTRDAVLVAVARALCAIVDHDDASAAQLISEVASTHEASPILDQHLRRFLPIGYVLVPSLRARWDSAQLGPTHQKSRAISRLLFELRSGRRVSTSDLEPAHVFTAFPLPWSIELACRLHANRHSNGPRLAEWLVDQVPAPARAELRYLTGISDGRAATAVARAAGDLLAHLPSVPSRQLEISVLGPLRLAFDGVVVDAAELRRARVRTLLALLVVHGSLSRDRAIDLLWPDLDLRDGGRNLRVTLTYLRQLLEPDRPTGEASFHLRADAATISLHSSDHLVVDLWELRRLRQEASRSRESADIDRTISLLSAATNWWRGEPLSDLASVVGEDHEIEHVRLLHVESLLQLGELRLVRGQTAAALLDAERVLALEPYSERAHRLAIASVLRGRDRERTDQVIERALAMLDEIGVEPEPATRILLRQAS